MRTNMNIEDFKKLSREDMVTEIIAADRDSAKGKTKVRKAELIDIYERILLRKAVNVAPLKLLEVFSPDIQEKALAMLRTFPNDVEFDLHRVVAAVMFETAYEQVTDHQRDQVKAKAYGAMYGASPTGRLPGAPQDPERVEPVAEGPVVVETGYTELEARMAAEIAKEVDSTLVDPEALAAVEKYVQEELSVPSGVDSSQMGAPIGMVLKKGRRQILVEALNHLAHSQLQMIARYKNLAADAKGNRKSKRAKDALRVQIGKFLPKGATLDEVLAVVNT